MTQRDQGTPGPERRYYTAAAMERLTGTKAATWLHRARTGKVQSHLVAGTVYFCPDELFAEPRVVVPPGADQSYRSAPPLQWPKIGRPRKCRRGEPNGV